ncbi:MAG: hypothetical protein Q9199_005285, partial [Rusavskia elegans]
MPAEALKIYDIDNCLPNSSLPAHLSSLAQKDSDIRFYIKDIPRDALPSIAETTVSTDTKLLHPAIDECRVTKDSYEIALLRRANTISTAAHTAVLRAIPTARNEQDLEAVFTASCISNGAKHQAYHGIFGSGENAATLHYQHNNQPLSNRKNILVDAGAEWNCYCFDVTRTMPLTGTFDPQSRAIYTLVQRMQSAALALLKPTVKWETLHTRAHEIATQGLLDLGILRNGTAEELMKERISVAFFPHGLGHYLGMDTHDTGGNPDYGDPDAMFR